MRLNIPVRGAQTQGFIHPHGAPLINLHNEGENFELGDVNRCKLIFFYGCTPSGGNPTPSAWEFYDLQNDPSEMRNQYANPEYANVIADLKSQLWKTRRDLNEIRVSKG